ncbi:hypothetical protein PC129_g4521 [Phytophthora cactorum]|uniref:Uncharacterized protein n=1 Tax=Phytophthora cactorum TaxID=29920 RepID=A0A8T1E2P7_9STRA|nr:hypothetical protein Pcac1_g14939 [Phytophthora cactorum]KAG2833753.1 hypothetical protein PC112_g6366 [Phytophthora cactorum]KAG2835945.1 hypothetical protein PC111_g5234 [Phytophthora cactorum]KAG2862047.1 hypothetical protein PC113_g6646 [Phytophthora cactorum]KAG2919567.1 hypothetical protein PC114_g6425 [Phytophthora cactorum]
MSAIISMPNDYKSSTRQRLVLTIGKPGETEQQTLRQAPSGDARIQQGYKAASDGEAQASDRSNTSS